MSALITQDKTGSLAIADDDLIDVLRNSLYPGATENSIKLVLSYCKAAGLDPMQKPVHIVPMPVKTGRKNSNGYDETTMRDVIMPGIGLYRTQAARSGQHAGTSEPEFGPTKSLTWDGGSIEYPEWCRVVVSRRLPSGEIAQFSAIEYWLENYATAGRNSTAPNAMWKRRSRGQLAKCAEGQALRKAFPEFGAAPTAEELEGKVMEDVIAPDDYIESPKIIRPPQRKSAAVEPEVIDVEPSIEELPAEEESGELASEGERAFLKKRAGDNLEPLLNAVGATSLESLTAAQFENARKRLAALK